jgi:hypothetical protein
VKRVQEKGNFGRQRVRIPTIAFLLTIFFIRLFGQQTNIQPVISPSSDCVWSCLRPALRGQERAVAGKNALLLVNESRYIQYHNVGSQALQQ